MYELPENHYRYKEMLAHLKGRFAYSTETSKEKFVEFVADLTDEEKMSINFLLPLESDNGIIFFKTEEMHNRFLRGGAVVSSPAS